MGRRVRTKESLQEQLDSDGRNFQIIHYPNHMRDLKSEFQCEHGHIWAATANHVVVRGTGCPICMSCSSRPNIRQMKSNSCRTEEDIQAELDSTSRGIQLVFYAGIIHWPTSLFRCEKDHIWKGRVINILNGRGCPLCAKYACDSDALYIWEAVGQRFHNKKVYKIGITSYRLGANRINGVARDLGCFYNLVLYEHILNAQQLERALLDGFTDTPGYEGFCGCTEFRLLDDHELQIALDVVEQCKVPIESVIDSESH